MLSKWNKVMLNLERADFKKQNNHFHHPECVIMSDPKGHQPPKVDHKWVIIIKDLSLSLKVLVLSWQYLVIIYQMASMCFIWNISPDDSICMKPRNE